MIRVFPVYSAHVRLPGPSVHAFLPPPPPTPGPVFPMPGPSCVHVEQAHTIKWAHPGKLTTTVELDRLRAAKDGHDTGALIAHVGLPPNAGMVLTILASKYKLLFCAGSVQANGSPLATYFPVLAPPQFCSAPCSLPAVLPPLNNLVPFPNTVGVGMNAWDFAAGWAGVLLESGIDLLFTFLFAGMQSPFQEGAKEIAQQAAEAAAVTFKAIAQAIGPALLKQFLEDLLKEGIVAVLKGIVAYTLQGEGGRLDLPILGVGIEYDPKGRKLNIGPPGDPARLGSVDLGPRPPSPPVHALGSALPEGTPHAA